MQHEGRRVILLLDNFSGHRCSYNPENIEVVYLPPNTTSLCQPLDAGVIRSFKSHFKFGIALYYYQAILLIKMLSFVVTTSIDEFMRKPSTGKAVC